MPIHLKDGTDEERLHWRSFLIKGAVFASAAADLELWWADTQGEDPLASVRGILQVVSVDPEVLGAADDSIAFKQCAERLTDALQLVARSHSAHAIPVQRMRTSIEAMATPADPFAALAAQVDLVARKTYDEDWASPDLIVERLRHPPHPAPVNDEHTATAVTNLTGARRAVQLQLCVGRFGPRAYATLAYILLHEYLSHAAAPAMVDPQTGVAKVITGNCSYFAEGLMDWAAVHLLTSLRGVGPDGRDVPAFRVQGRALSDSLAGVVKNGDYRLRGHQAAEAAVEWVRREYGTEHGRPEDVVADLAFAINLTERPLPIKDRLVLLMAESLRWPMQRQLEQALRGWVRRRIAPGTLLDVVEHLRP